MKKQQPKKRYRSSQQICREIDEYKSKSARFMLQANKLDAEAEGYIRSGLNLQLAEDRQLEAKRLRKKAYRIEQHRLPYLGQKLAEFNTPMLKALDDGDLSISTKG